ncbi:hypothetical protein [Flavobacterium sp. BFFFF1]|uniref:hypothetical protein n=1 Tax=Flavobacterium sp. BFFFF1 TaxID=2015557 RepID=UPI0025BBADD7|nr:hypothetical protein [Flavobacterium sp. BFFFF1]
MKYFIVAGIVEKQELKLILMKLINLAQIKYSLAKLKEAFGIESIARLVRISATILLSRIISIAKNIRQPIISQEKVFQGAWYSV